MAAAGTQRVGCDDAAPSSYLPRRLAFARNLADRAHTLVIKAHGASGHPTVAIDGPHLMNPG
jgi:hypothetical protein